MNNNYYKCLALVTACYFLGGIHLAAQEKVQSNDTTQLAQVTVTAKKQLVKQQMDRIIYNMQADPQSKTTNLLDMMRKVPMLSLDAEDNLLLKGNSDYKILINGRPSGMMDGNARNILRSMPASTIDRIEVITSPPAKYDNEGLAGIINIITVKKIDNGYRGSVNLNGQFPEGGPGIGSSVTVKSGRLGISAFGGASLFKSPLINTSSNRNNQGTTPADLLQSGAQKSKTRSGYLGLEISYEVDSVNLISAQLGASRNINEGESNLHSALYVQEEIIQGYHLNNNNENNGAANDVSINYQRSAKKNKEQMLTFSYRYKNNKGKLSGILNLTNQINQLDPDYRQLNDHHTMEQTFQIDYVQPVKHGSFEMGGKSIFRNNRSTFSLDSLDLHTGYFITDNSRSDHFANDQNVYAAYGSYKYNREKWGFQAGIRTELTTISADYISGSVKIDRSYFNMTPSLSLMIKLDDISNITAGYTSRIKRPNIYRLNPFVDRSNINYESSGNPNLKPVLQRGVQLGYGRYKKSSVSVGIEYSFFKDLDLRVLSFDSLNNITRSTYQNIGKGSGLSLYFNFTYPITKEWEASINGNLTYIWISGRSEDDSLTLERLMHGISLTSGYNFPKSFRTNFSLNINGRNPQSFQEISNAMISSAWSVSKSLLSNKLTLSATIKNPFRKYRINQVEARGTDFLQITETRNYFRTYVFSANFNFGKLKNTIKKIKRGINNDDTSKGNNGL